MGISFFNVTFSYPSRSEQVILNVPEWQIHAGEHVLIQGPSGSGKTTFLKLIAGLLRPGTGAIKILGERIDKMSNSECDFFRARNIGYVFQNFNLIPYLNVIDNIRLAAKFANTAEDYNVDNEICNLLTTLNVEKNDWELSTRYLSYGQIQRVAIARAMINRPKIIIADEPTSSLDASNKKVFLDLLMSLVIKHKISLVLVSHDQSLSSYFGRVELFSDINIMKKNSQCL